MERDDWVPWSVYEKHIEETGDGFKRLAELEAEVRGDVATGRPSLRNELGSKIQEETKKLADRVDRSNANLKAIGIPILIAVLLKILLDWIFIQPSLAELRSLEAWKNQQDNIRREQMRWNETEPTTKH